MRFLSINIRITLGLVTILLSTILLVIFSGFSPDARQAAMRGRKKLCEAIAINSSILVSQNQLARLEEVLRALVDRDEQLLSAGLRRFDGRMMVEIGNHDACWVRDAERSTETQVQVPLWSSDSRWGNVELRFRPVTTAGLRGLLRNPWTMHMALVGALTFVTYSMYLRMVLRQLDPSKAIPKRVRSALDALAEGLLVTDKKGRVVLANEAFARWTGQDPDKLIGRNAATFPWCTPGDETEERDFPWTRALAERLPQAHHLMELNDDRDRRLTLVANASPVLGHDGEYRGVLTSFEDVTELEKHKVELSNAKQAADAANQAKSEFLARMSHEIRTPMNAILGYTDVLRRGFAENEQQREEYLRTIQNSGEHLLALINDILDLSKVEAGRMELEMARHSPFEVMSQIISVLRVKAEEKGLELRFEADGKLPETVLTDAVRLRQTLINLVGNAIKFTEAGSVRVVARLLPQPRRLLAIDVTDTGIGMSKEALKRIFDPFSQADTTITRRYGGTGLGLSISRQLAEKMGGDISVTSRLGEGTTFTITIDPGPLDDVRLIAIEEAQVASSSSDTESADEPTTLPPSRILVVDDGEENRQLVCLFLGRLGLDVLSAENGQVAVEMASEQEFDAILMDMQMPVMDGITATQQLRALGCTTPIIALTANVMQDDERRCREAGCNGFLTKPIDMDRLVQALGQMLSTDRGTGTNAPPTNSTNSRARGPADTPNDNADRRPPARPATETAADDHVASPVASSLNTQDPRIRAIVEAFVRRLADRITEMRDAESRGDFAELANLAHWLKGAGGTVGFHVFTEPASLLQASATACDEEDVAKHLDHIEDIAKCIRLDDPQPTAAAAPSAVPAATNTSENRSHAECSEVDALQDVHQEITALSGNARLAAPVTSSLPMEDPKFREIVTQFVERLAERVRVMRQLAKEKDYIELAKLAHWLKGTGGTVGFTEFTDPARRLQSSAEAGDDATIAECLDAIDDVRNRIQIVSGEPA